MESHRILIVDDSPSVRETLSDILSLRGYAPVCAATGEAGLEAVKEEPPSVALVDLKLKDMSGVSVIRQIKETCPRTQCIILTGFASQATAIEAINLGAYGYLEKTCGVEQLLETIEGAIAKGQPAKAQEGDERYERLFYDSLSGIAFSEVVANAEGKPVDLIILQVNRALGDLAGIHPDEVVGQRVTQVLPGLASDRMLEVCGQVASTGEPSQFKEYLAALNGDFEITVFSIQKGRVGMVFTNISERVRARESARHRGGSVEDLQDYTMDLEQLLEERISEIKRVREELARSRRMATMGEAAHEGIKDLRKPLAKVSNAVYFLKRSLSEADETIKGYLDVISSGTLAAEEIVSRLLDVLRRRPR